MENGIVVDSKGNKIDFILLDNGIPVGYELKKGETIISEQLDIGLGMLKPKWTDSEWVETATEKEIEEWLYPDGRPEIVIFPKTNAELEEELLTTQLAAAENFEQVILLQEELEKANQAIDIANAAIVNIYESMI